MESSESDSFHKILLGGDQLSTAMARRVQGQRDNSTSTFDALEGIIPICEDWLCLLTVLDYMYVNFVVISPFFYIGYFENTV